MTIDPNIQQAIKDYPNSEVYTDQEGGIWLLDGATCPRCPEPSKLAHRHGASGYFNCPACDVMYDEPHFDPDDIVGWTEDFED